MNRKHSFFCVLLFCPFFLALSQTIQLPVEVIGEDGYIKQIRFNLERTVEGDVLYLKIHRPVFLDVSTNTSAGAKASIKLNNANWLDLNNDNTEPFPHELKYGGLNGTYHTVRMKVPVNSLKNGENVLRFRFNGTDGFTNGYRVLEFNVMRGNDLLLATNTFEYDDPKQWLPPLNNSTDIERGKELWETALLKESPIDDTPLRAKCASCHAADGRDLKYFNYSNWSIQERSKFHGLSQKEADQIASYIRSLNVPTPTKARPWNPPYQPGPGLDSKPVEEWAAGAGLEAVLEEDSETKENVFGNDISFNNLKTVGDIKKTLNVRETKIAIQLPDWNSWLPEVHPLDIIGDQFNETTVFNNETLDDSYKELKKLLDENTLSSIIEDERLKDRLYLLAEQSTNLNNRTIGNLNLDANTPNGDKLEYRHIVHWGAIKTWDIMQTYDLDGIAPDIFGEYGEKRSWISLRRNVFEMAPHRLAGNRNTLPWQDIKVGKYFSTAWYQLQLTINAGNRRASHLWPVDWNYQPNHIAGLHTSADGPKHPYRYLLSHIKMLQQYDDRRSISDRTALGLRQLHPARYTSYANGSHSIILEDLGPIAKRNAYEVLLTMTMDLLDKHPINDWLRGEDTSIQYTVRPKDYVPVVIPENKFSLEVHLGKHADAWFTMIPSFREDGVREVVLNRLIDWGEKMWPAGDWESLRVDDTPPPASFTLQNYTPPTSIVPGETYTINIPYIGTGFADMQISLQNKDENWKTEGSTLVSINDNGTATLNVKVNPEAPLGTNYHWQAYITPVGGNWSNRYDNKLVDNISCVNNLNRISDSKINFYPNPVFDQLTLDTSDLLEKIEGIKIYDLQGRVAKAISKNELKASSTQSIDVSDITDGMYILSIDFYKKETQNVQFIIKH
ncbi:T9SS type A sorting domain-containing protein [uncultured Aquimarina sp.]|uniref:T9SS type A sorting domain-containing protein n=1 Tax=uncultured Aquimarina sp. TaxID=575652 RepID=UPI0026291522|nr:T9SS type A sorting domain-containing protein [uncultured Aquimarina sp.]